MSALPCRQFGAYLDVKAPMSQVYSHPSDTKFECITGVVAKTYCKDRRLTSILLSGAGDRTKPLE